MEERKIKEIEHYDQLAKEWQNKVKNKEIISGDVEMIDVMKMSSYRFIYDLLKKHVADKRVLDYGCGHGMHTIPIAKMGAKEVVGIDLSEESLKIAQERAEHENLSDKINFIKMDAETLEFPDNSFDVIFDGGTFSSIDIRKAFPELARVLKPDGYLIGIETLGHNPLINLKRWLNKKRGIRTEWATKHIMKMPDFKLAQQYFQNIDIDFFHLKSIVAIPFQDLSGGSTLVRILEALDRVLFKLPFLRRYAFKSVFVFSKPKNKKAHQ